MRQRVRKTFGRFWERAPTILLLAGTVALAYSIAHFAVGHASPALACTVALSSLSLTRDARPRRVAETAIAMVTGITLSAGVVVLAGRGPLQVLGTALVVLAIATLVSRNPAFALSAATQAMLVAVLPDPEGGPFTRAFDGAIGGVCALLVTALVPMPALGRALRAGDAVLRETVIGARMVAEALRDADSPGALAALEKLRGTEARLAEWKLSLDAAAGVAAFAPASRRRRGAWERRMSMHRGVASAVADLRMIARRSAVITRTGRPQPRAAGMLDDICAGLDALLDGHRRGEALTDPEPLLQAGRRFTELAAHRSVDPGIVAMLRQLVVDGLVASGMNEEDARRALPEADTPQTDSIQLPR